MPIHRLPGGRLLNTDTDIAETWKSGDSATPGYLETLHLTNIGEWILCKAKSTWPESTEWHPSYPDNLVYEWFVSHDMQAEMPEELNDKFKPKPKDRRRGRGVVLD